MRPNQLSKYVVICVVEFATICAAQSNARNAECYVDGTRSAYVVKFSLEDSTGSSASRNQSWYEPRRSAHFRLERSRNILVTKELVIAGKQTCEEGLAKHKKWLLDINVLK
jgi:hypothetical protein